MNTDELDEFRRYLTERGIQSTVAEVLNDIDIEKCTLEYAKKRADAAVRIAQKTDMYANGQFMLNLGIV